MSIAETKTTLLRSSEGKESFVLKLNGGDSLTTQYVSRFLTSPGSLLIEFIWSINIFPINSRKDNVIVDITITLIRVGNFSTNILFKTQLLATIVNGGDYEYETNTDYPKIIGDINPSWMVPFLDGPVFHRKQGIKFEYEGFKEFFGELYFRVDPYTNTKTIETTYNQWGSLRANSITNNMLSTFLKRDSILLNLFKEPSYEKDSNNPVRIQLLVSSDKPPGGNLSQLIVKIYDDIPHPIYYPNTSYRIKRMDRILTCISMYVEGMYTVLIGNGCSFTNKLLDITNNPDVYNDIILYGLLRYILSWLLYGKLSYKYILNEYNDKFYYNLSRSRYCNFIEEFKNLGDINKYYK